MGDGDLQKKCDGGVAFRADALIIQRFPQIREIARDTKWLVNATSPERKPRLADPSPGLRASGAPDYRGEVWLAETGAALPATLLPGQVEVGVPEGGTVVINQNAFRGWTVRGEPASAREGLLSAALPAGIYTFHYQPPGLWLGFGLSALGLLGLAVFARSRAPDPGARSTSPR